MKEWVSNIDPVDVDQVVWPQLVMGHMVGQKDMLTDNILFSSNPEKYPTIIPDPIEPPLQPPVVPTRPLPLEFYNHPQNPRGRR